MIIAGLWRYGDWRRVATGCNALVGMKDNGQYCWDILLRQQNNFRCCYRVVCNNFVFQQASALVQLLQCKTLNFLSPELWPHNSPELNSTDYEIYRVIAARA